jgi:hypothetical protein
MEYWNSGKMEYWGSNADDSLILFSDQCHLYKKRYYSAKPNIPTFHYSNTPSLSIMAQPINSELALSTRFPTVE